MSDESSLVELDSSLESETDLTDCDTSEPEEDVGMKLRFQGQTDSDDNSEHKPKRWWQSRKSAQSLSVQSGDIVRPEPTSMSGPKSCYSQVKKAANRVFTIFLKLVFLSPVVKKSWQLRIPVISPLILVLNMVMIGLLIWGAIVRYPPIINISLRSFTIPSHPAQKHWDAFTSAKAGRLLNSSSDLSAIENNNNVKRDTSRVTKRDSTGDCLGQSHQTISMSRYDTWNLDIIYRIPEPVTDKNLLTRERISRIQNFESTIYQSGGYKAVCHKKTPGSVCDRITSLMSSLYPTKDDGSFVYSTPDGFTPNLTASLLQFQNQLDQALWFTGGQITFVKSTSQIKAKLLRSQISVGLPLPCFDGVTYDNVGPQKDRVWDYYHNLVPYFEQSDMGDIEVLYGGTALYDYQVDSAEFHDAMLSIASFGLIIVVVFILCGFSVWLTVLSLYSVFSCFPLAFFAYRVVLGIETLNVLNIISLFVVIGIGVDDVFVFINTFKQSASHFSSPDNLHQRLGHTILTAGKATFVTSLTTSVAFFSNAISSIPAVKQFGMFMGLVVIFCYLQVLIVLPLALHIWHCVFRRLQNLCFYPCTRLCRTGHTIDAPNVRLSELETGDNEPDTSSIESEDLSLETTDQLLATPSKETSEALLAVQKQITVKDIEPIQKIASFLQTVMLYCVARPVLSFQLFNIRSTVALWFSRLFCVIVYVCSLLVAVLVVVCLLGFTDRPPQLFNSNTNIQKLLDLSGNLSESGGFSYTGGGLPYIPPPTSPPVTLAPQTTRPPLTTPPVTHPQSPGATTGRLPTAATELPTTHAPETTQAEHNPTTHAPETPPATTRAPAHTNPPPNTHPPPQTAPPATTGKTTPFVPATNGPTKGPSGPGDEVDITSSLYSNNLVVNVVFGIKDVYRLGNASSSFLPENDYAILEDSFYGNMTCSSKVSKIDLTGTVRALCRICTNISRSDNGLIMEGNYNCFPRALLSQSGLQCLYNIAVNLPECRPVLYRDTKNVSVTAESAYYYNSNTRGVQLRFLAMAFRSRTNPNLSPSESIKDYQHWEEFILSELNQIKEQSGSGQLYQGADQLLFSGFQTSQKWVEVNIEALAVDGSIYGICVSVLLCMIIIVFLTYNWRVFFAIKLTVLHIIFSLLAMFVVFGWKLGIVEAITLTIVVGNSLDYCIHLCEGYMAATPQQIAYVEKFKVISKASIRVKRVAVSISFVGVSIMSSAVTTILATIPMLATTIELFTRFGQILLLNTLLAITYTLVFCSTFLALFGPTDSKFTKARAVNAVVTVSTTIVVYPLLLILLLYILSQVGVPILSAEGYPLFS